MKNKLPSLRTIILSTFAVIYLGYCSIHGLDSLRLLAEADWRTVEVLYLNGNPIRDIMISHLSVLNLPRMIFMGINFTSANASYGWDCLMGNWKSLSCVQIGQGGQQSKVIKRIVRRMYE